MTTNPKNQASPERRFFKATECRVAEADGKPRVVSGYGAVFYDAGRAETQIELWENVFERIMPGAFDRALAERQDVRCLFNHDPNQILGRTTSGTCRLAVDAVGLRYEADENRDDGRAGEIIAQVKRGDVSGSSFSFVARLEKWIDDQNAGVSIREIYDCDLFDVGPVTFPWYPGTTAAARAVGDPATFERMAAEAAERRAKLIAAAADETSSERERIEIDYQYAQIRRRLV